MSFPELLAQTDRAVLGLGGQVRYVTSTGEDIALAGVFDAAYVVASAGDAGVSSSTPAVFVRLSDLVTTEGRAVDPEEDSDQARVIVDGASYRVREIKKDGMGAVVLMLHRA